MKCFIKIKNNRLNTLIYKKNIKRTKLVKMSYRRLEIFYRNKYQDREIEVVKLKINLIKVKSLH